MASPSDAISGFLAFDSLARKAFWLIVLFFWWPYAGAPVWMDTIRVIASNIGDK